MGRKEMDFYKRAEIVCRHIPYGTVATYGQIALLTGKPANARQVGYALRKGKLGEGIPAHRVVNAQGILSGAAAFEVYDLQKRLLEKEGILVIRTDKGWKTDLRTYGWKHTAEDALWFRAEFAKRGI